MTFTAIGDTLGDNFLTIILLTVFQVDRGVSEGFSVELARDRTW
jgi:hypothetical protein